MTYKMLVIDVDDTLITDNRIITEPTKQALDEAMKQGIIVTLATGRMYASAKNIAGQLEINVPLITYQGSLVKNLLDGEVLYERSVPRETAQFLLEYALQNDLHIQAYVDDTLYAMEDNEKVKKYAELSGVPYTIEPDFAALLEQPSTKILYFEEPERVNAIQKALTGRIGEAVHITTSKPYFLEFLHKEGTKGHALQFLANRFGCQLDEVIAIGDGWNDREMIQIAGLGVAMSNAVDELKRIADYITLSNNKDGVKHVIDKFILQQ